MEAVAEELSRYLVDRLKDTPPDGRLLVGIAGVPASGKSTLAHLIVERVNAAIAASSGHSPADNAIGAAPSDKPVAVFIGLDGWHLTRARLDEFPDPKLAHDRRGAHWTFDGDGYVAFVRALREPLAPTAASSERPQVVYAPSFSHEKKDPVFDAIPVYPHHRLVIIEGLYTFLAIPPWSAAAELLDERWYVDIAEDEAERRLVKRHVKTGVARDLEEAVWRSRENDAPNGRFLQENMMKPTRTIPSIEDPRLDPGQWRTQGAGDE
ncbi:P-loop containing nucleoside triphosphate hydrolase protein [Trametes versicolor FP-101664 SS1]|uniref:P-loop containing nucleoside triphosphate hydrolase protein n=1 Tax=Trametes versicolor (strain FP-101664) TaxID=717944 RepID=UPI0004622322|nr:P-loop containing nucleoside triphosphate hydrolase protein [Trametes versicolor FP-101664 SS1]EIW65101.1 P-loop containing nucleoside triphosphate hydrolase protein [Trametes versicolor FP-101664 SS1]